MTEITSINTSFYSELLEGFAPKSTLPVSAVQANPEESFLGYAGGKDYAEADSVVDLSNYYNEVRPEDFLTKSGQYLVASSQKLDNTMVIAMQNGYSVQDVCNIRLAEMAYKASAYVFDVAEEMSTFVLDV
ncbi:hypothetical protein J6R97_05080 [bacterium]|nr:hypothetical protein [bacterium]